jgi:photosystem II stability/assembly factor-like uncharacterized protein
MGLLISQAVPPVMAAQCDLAQFISDLTIPDGSTFTPGAAFTKTWRLQNAGTCTWETSYSLVAAGGDAMGTPSVRLPVSVPPGQMVDISVTLTAPNSAGHYKSLWKLSNSAGVPFGIGDSADDPFWVDINVINTSAVVFDFVANASYAQWKSGAGALPFPGASGDSRGYSAPVNNPHLEDDSFDSASGLLTVPQNKFNGYIQATYPEFQVQAGDTLQTLVNCEFGASSCYVTFRIDYLLPSGVQRTLWSFKEAYDKRFYRASLDLTPLAGQKVRFVFMLLSSGLAGGDRALWGAPRIVRTGTSQPPAPPSTLTALPPLTPTATPITPPPTVQAGGCDRATFVADVTVQDGTTFAPGAVFTKTWRLKNTGACVWTTAYKLIYYSGEPMSAPTTVNLPWGAAANQTVDISVNMVAPPAPGNYRGFWILANASGQFFGIGPNAMDPVWVEINVAGDPGSNTTYDFMTNVCSAQWKSGAGILPCPGANGDSRGFAFPLSPAALEDGSVGPAGLVTFPQNRYNGYIQGTYPAFTVQPGDRFQSSVGCEQGASCYVTFRLDYMTASGYIATFWQRREQNDGRYYAADVDLTPLAGRSIRFILTVLATGYATNDRAVWSGPRIVRTDAATPTITPVPPQWLTYTNQQYGLQFNYPPQAQIVNETSNSVKMNLPFIPGTNLVEKYLQLSVNENVDPCQSPLSDTSRPGSPTETVVINGISFFKQVGGDAAAGNLREWVGYSTQRNNGCISMNFMLHSLGAGAYQTPPPVFDKAAESAMFTQIMNTFAFLAIPTPTGTSVPPTPTSLPPTLTPVPGTPVASPNIRSLHMIDSANGWALSDQHVLRTTDGGATWFNVLADNRPSGGYFGSSGNAWVISDLAGTSVGSLYRTTNGGIHWTKFDVPFNSGKLQFLDDNNGFVLYGEPSGMQKQAVALYQTTDGGATWTLKYDNNPTLPNPSTSLPFSGHKMGMTFRDPTTGWVGGDIPTNGFVYLYKTTDSGISWAQVSLPLPAGYPSAFITTTAPKFFGGNDAVLPVWMTLGVGMRDLFLYTTHDGGATWQVSPAFARNAGYTDIISASAAISWDWAHLFHVTNNGGSTWSTVTPNMNFAEDFRELDFVTPTTGWARLQLPDGRPALYRTTDGGATWVALYGQTSPPSAPDPSAFAQSLVDTLNARNFDALPASMDQSFTFGYWESQGTSYPTAQAIESLRSGLTVTLIPDASKDLNSLLGGLNPYSIMGLDPARSYGLFVSGWGSDSNSEAILYVTQRADGSLYWHSVLVAPARFIHATPTPSATAPALIGPYAVIGVAVTDVLNIRSAAGTGQPLVGSFAYDAVNVMRTGPTAIVDGAAWVEVQNPGGGTGWVNSFYLSDYVSHDAFCADTRIPALIGQLKGSMNQSNGGVFSTLVSPVHGVDVRLWAYQPAVHFNTSAASNLFTSSEIYDWGIGPRGGTEPDTGTFTQIIQPKLQEVLNAPTLESYCDDLTKVYPLSNPWPYINIRYYNLYKPSTTPTDLDFRTWLIGFEYIDGQPYLHSMVTIQWEP